MKSKKALTEDALSMLVLGLIGLFVILLFVVSMLKDAGLIVDQSTCRESVIMNSRLRIDSIPVGESIKCPTNNMTIKGTDDAKIKNAIAEEMSRCWQNMGEGKLELFGARNEKFCVVCSLLSFEKKEPLTGFGSFLAYSKPKGSNESYLEYFSGVDKDNENVSLQVLYVDSQSTVDLSKKQAVMFIYAKQSKWPTVKKAAIGGTAGAVTAAAAATVGLALVASGAGAPLGFALISQTIITAAGLGAVGGGLIAANAGADKSTWNAGILLIPEEDISEVNCTYIPKTK